jgi:hypothetical protein
MRRTWYAARAAARCFRVWPLTIGTAAKIRRSNASKIFARAYRPAAPRRSALRVYLGGKSSIMSGIATIG